MSVKKTSQKEIKPDQKLVSVIMGARDRFDYRLTNAIESIKLQTIGLDKIEIILVDYSSLPKFEEKYKNFCKKEQITCVNYTDAKKWNRAHALNIGLNKAKTKYALVTDMDIIFAPNFLEEALKELKKDTGCVVYSSMREIQGKKYAKKISIKNEYDKILARSVPRSSLRKAIYSDFGIGIFFTTKENILSIGGFDEKYSLWGYEDRDIIERFKFNQIKVNNISNKTTILHQSHEKFEGVKTKRLKLQIMKNKLRFHAKKLALWYLSKTNRRNDAFAGKA